MADLMKRSRRIRNKKRIPSFELVILSLFTTKLERVKKLEHSFSKELLSKEEVLVTQTIRKMSGAIE
jgi:cell division protein FtsB